MEKRDARDLVSADIRRFRRHLRRATRRVERWPLWKKTALGAWHNDIKKIS